MAGFRVDPAGTQAAPGRIRRRRTSRPPLFVALDGSGHTSALVGGKAASLDVLVQRGFPVPSSAALTSAAYQAFINSSGLKPMLSSLGHAGTLTLAAAQDQWKEIEDAFLQAPLTAELEAAIFTAWQLISEGDQVAVRSSATAEDMAQSSFAGQYLSVLEVEGPVAVEESVRRVWASLWQPAARAYRAHMGISDDDLAMGVVVQRMIPADRSGVAFTIDPTEPGALRLEVVDGLGEALVSGEATPDVYRLSRPGLQPLEGHEPPPELRQVARFALRIEEEMGGHPQDVEWSVAGDHVAVLQARPITTLELELGEEGDGFDTPTRTNEVFIPSGVSEMLPGVLPPLLWTINGPMVEDAFRTMLDRLGVAPEGLAEPYAMLGRIRGQAALNLSLVKASASRMAGGSGADIERQYLGRPLNENPEPEPKPGFRKRLARLGPTWRAMRLGKKVELEAEEFEAIADRLTSQRRCADDMLDGELIAYRARLRDLASTGVATEVAVAATAVASYRGLEVALERWLGSDAAQWVQRITRGTSEEANPIVGAASAVWQEFESRPGAGLLRDVLRSATSEDVEDRLRGTGALGEAFLERLADAIEALGSSAVYAGPTWSEQSEYVWGLLLHYFGSGTVSAPEKGSVAHAAETDLAELELVLTRTWKWRATRIITGQIVDVRRRVLRKLAAEARSLLKRRETVKAALLVLGGEERRVALVLGDRLARRGVLPKADDAELLSDWELDDLILGRVRLQPGELERRRQVLEQYRSEPVLPAVVNAEFEANQIIDLEGGIRGWAASPGRHRGRVRVITDLLSASDLEPGEILVAAATDPSWTPLFLIAGGIIVERGGPLSHAAIVSRELGVPAVLNAVNATTILRTGDLVEIDGSRGTVTLLPAEEEVA